jgi:hypothetical protein
MTRDEIIRELRILMEPRPIPVSELAARCGVSRQTIYDARRGYVPERVRRVLSDALTDVRDRQKFDGLCVSDAKSLRHRP